MSLAEGGRLVRLLGVLGVLSGCHRAPGSVLDDDLVELHDHGHVLAVATNGELLSLVTRRNGRVTRPASTGIWLSVFDIEARPLGEYRLAGTTEQRGAHLAISDDGMLWVSVRTMGGTSYSPQEQPTTLLQFDVRDPASGLGLEPNLTVSHPWSIDGWGVDDTGHVGLGGRVSGSTDTTIARLSPGGDLLWRSQLQTDGVGCQAFDVASDGRMLCVQGGRGRRRWAVYQPDGTAHVRELGGRRASRAVRFLRDGAVAVADASGDVGIFEETGELGARLVRELDFDLTTASPVVWLEQDPRHDTIYVTEPDGAGAHVRRYDFDGLGREHWLLPHDHNERTHHLRVLPDGRRLVVVGLDADSVWGASVAVGFL